MHKLFQLNFIAATIAALMLTGCGDAETNIVEKDSIVEESDEHDHEDGEDGDDGFTIESMGRLAVLSAESNAATLYDLDDNDLLDTFSLIHDSNTITSSAGYRFAIIRSRDNDHVGFIDGGLWREDHTEHLHDFEQAPVMSTFELSTTRPTHIVKHDGQTAIFFDGDADSGVSASVQVLSDTDISGELSEIPTLNYSINMHGVAEPNGEYLIASIRRDDAESTSTNTVLPDQVGVYHLHDNEYEQEQVLDVTCPDLHGASQNGDYAVFGCGDGVLVIHEHDDTYEAEKINNIDELDGIRIGAVYGHEESDSFIGVASGTLISINPENEMETLEWQPEEGVSSISYAFSYEAEYFIVLDSEGYLNILTAHDHDGLINWELEERLDISEEDVSTMTEDMSFSMTMAQNGHYVYVSDPLAKHILQINLETMSIESDIEVDFVPESLVWLGIEEEEHEH